MDTLNHSYVLWVGVWFSKIWFATERLASCWLTTSGWWSWQSEPQNLWRVAEILGVSVTCIGILLVTHMTSRRKLFLKILSHLGLHQYFLFPYVSSFGLVWNQSLRPFFCLPFQVPSQTLGLGQVEVPTRPAGWVCRLPKSILMFPGDVRAVWMIFDWGLIYGLIISKLIGIHWEEESSVSFPNAMIYTCLHIYIYILIDKWDIYIYV